MKPSSLKIDFLKFQDQLVFQTKEGQLKVYDPIRRKYLVKGPEEIVRQLVILYLMELKGVNKNHIAVEKMLKINGLIKRFDLLIYNKETDPVMLVECKAPNVSISEDTFRQISAYNIAMKARYLLVTNGIKTYCCEIDYLQHSFEFLAEVPSFAEPN